MLENIHLWSVYFVFENEKKYYSVSITDVCRTGQIEYRICNQKKDKEGVFVEEETTIKEGIRKTDMFLSCTEKVLNMLLEIAKEEMKKIDENARYTEHPIIFGD